MPDTPPSHAREAMAALSAGDLDRAQRLAALQLRTDPDHFDALQVVAAVATGRKDLETAASAFRRLTELRREVLEPLVAELILEGLHQHLKLARDDLDSTVTYKEMLKFQLLRPRSYGGDGDDLN